MIVSQFMKDVYNTLGDQLEDDACVPGVENLYTEGKPCIRWYSEMLDVYGRLCDRLGMKNDDEDVEIIINSFLSICQEVGYHMYYYGAKFGNKQ